MKPVVVRTSIVLGLMATGGFAFLYNQMGASATPADPAEGPAAAVHADALRPDVLRAEPESPPVAQPTPPPRSALSERAFGGRPAETPAAPWARPAGEAQERQAGGLGSSEPAGSAFAAREPAEPEAVDPFGSRDVADSELPASREPDGAAWADARELSPRPDPAHLAQAGPGRTARWDEDGAVDDYPARDVADRDALPRRDGYSPREANPGSAAVPPNAFGDGDSPAAGNPLRGNARAYRDPALDDPIGDRGTGPGGRPNDGYGAPARSTAGGRPEFAASRDSQNPGDHRNPAYRDDYRTPPAGVPDRLPDMRGAQPLQPNQGAGVGRLSSYETAGSGTRGGFGGLDGADRPRTASAPGIGEPGPRQMEGPQTASVTIVKEGPPEVQVGKAARFFIKVRNVSQAPAKDVQVIDVAPRGAELIGATPAASPGPQGELMWMLGNMAPGEEKVIQLDLMPVAEGEIGSVAQLAFASHASLRTLCTRPELRLEVAAPKDVLIGEQLNLRIRIWNAGTGPAQNVVISEEIPEGLHHPDGPVLHYELGELLPNQSRELELSLQAARPGMVENILLARGEGVARAESRVQVQVVAPQLQTAIHGPSKRYLQRAADYSVSVGNPGTAPARDIELTMHLPRGFKFVKADGFGQYDPQKHRVLWSLEELPPGQRGSVNLTLLPIEQGDQLLAVEGKARLNLADRQEHLTLVEGIVALHFEVADTADPIDVNGQTTFEMRVLNQGSAAATEVQVVADLPPQMKVLSAEGPTPHVTQGNQVAFESLPRLAERADVTYRITVQGVAPGDLRSRFRLFAAELSSPISNEQSTRVFADE